MNELPVASIGGGWKLTEPQRIKKWKINDHI